MNDLDVAIATAMAGAAVVRRRFDTALQRLDKGGGDFATDADVEAERAMLALLRVARMRVNGHDAALVPEAAGCTRTDLMGNICGSGTTGLIAAADVETHSALLALVRRYLASHS